MAGLSAAEYNEKYSGELEKKFDTLKGYDEIEERLGYYKNEQQITDDLAKIEDSVLKIYSSNKEVDWKLIKPLKIRLNKLIKNLDYFKNSSENKQKVTTSRIIETRKLVKEIGELNTADNRRLKEHYHKDGFSEIKRETINLIDLQVTKLSNMIGNIWEGENIEEENQKLMIEFCSECDYYLNRNKNIFNNLKTKPERLDFVIDGLLEVIENIIGPSKFRLLLGKRFNIIDDLEDYSRSFYDVIEDYGLKDDIVGYLKTYIS